jgi:hypothetical protein
LLASSQEDSLKYLTKRIPECCEDLLQKLMNIEESGSTALGPALLTSVGLASEVRKNLHFQLNY